MLRKVADWDELQRRARERYEDGAARLPDEPDARQKQLTRMGNAAGAAGLTALMAGRDGREWFARAAERYRESWEHAPPGSWGRPIGAMKARILAGDWDGADGGRALGARRRRGGVRLADRPLCGRARVTACSGRGPRCASRPTPRALTRRSRPRSQTRSPCIAADNPVDYADSVEDVLESFETREAYLEDVPVADTVLVLQALAARRGMAAELESELLP